MHERGPAHESGSSNAALPAAQALAGLRIVVFLVWIARLAAAPLADLSVLPEVLLEPPLLLQAIPPTWWQGILHPAFLSSLQITLLVGVALVVVGARPHGPIALTVVALLTFEQALVRSFGFSSHAEIVPLLAAWVIACWPAADRWSIAGGLRRSGGPESHASGVFLIAAIGCWCYAATGMHRLAHYGPDLILGNSMSSYVIENSFRYGTGEIGAMLLQEPGWARWLQLAMLGTTIMEILAPLALVLRRFRYIWLSFVIGFHLGSAVLLDTFFWEMMLVVAASLVALDVVAPGSRESSAEKPRGDTSGSSREPSTTCSKRAPEVT